MGDCYEVLTLGYDLAWYAGPNSGAALGRAEELARILNDYTARGWSVVAACGDDKFRQVILRRSEHPS
jgi:hypothetical protein